jgi:hypothetical protein
MVQHPLTRARLLEIAASDRQAFLEAAWRRIEVEIERLHAADVRLWNGRSRRYHLQVLYCRRQKLADLARDAGYGDWTGDQRVAEA